MKKNIYIFAIIIGVIILNLYFGIPRIEKFSAIDEALWSYERVPKFWKSIEKGNWRGTSLCDKPGVTLAMISGIGLPFIPDPQKYEELRSEQKTPEQLDTINKIYFSLRLPIYLFTLLSLPVFYFFIRRLWGERTALFSVIFIGLSPILLGISLIVNTDAILWILMLFSLLSFLIYQKENNKKYLYISGFILAMAILNKFVANLLFPFLLALIFLKYILSDYAKEESIAYFKKSLKDYFILILITLLTIFIFYPKAWVTPKSVMSVTIFSMAFEKIWPFFLGALLVISSDTLLLKSIISRKICALFKFFQSIFIKMTAILALSLIAFVFLNVVQKMKYYDFESIFFWPKPDISFFQEFAANFLSAFFPLIYGLTPLVSIFFIIALILIISLPKIKEKNNLMGAFILLIFILIFYLANSAAQISSTVRYQIIAYPIASIIAAIGLSELLNSELLKKYFSKTVFYALLLLTIITSFASLKSIDPFFLSYSSELLPKKYIINPRDMADGSWEASQFLNNLPQAQNLFVWSDKKQVCEKFIGKCSKNVEKNISYDYFVTSRSAKDETFAKAFREKTQEYIIGSDKVNVPKLYSEEDPGSFKIVIGGRAKNYVKITCAELANN